MNVLSAPTLQHQLDQRRPAGSAIPSATYRLQLHKAFTFEDVTSLVGYFVRLGISHLYLSPIQVARAGSLHGYDVVDHRAINPELGGEGGLRRLAAACHQVGLGLIADIVPNHMAVGGADNPMWLDVLENGPDSQYALVFDIDFENTESALAGKVVAPVLGESYGDALKEGKLTLVWDPALKKLAFAYGPHRFPLRPQDYQRVAGDRPPEEADLECWRNADTLHDLLERQNFRLTWWNAAGDIINWRRFFDVNDLAGLRMEDDRVFRLTHEIILGLYAEGILDGVRVDHVDGLADPAAYLDRLKSSLSQRTPDRPPEAPQDGPYIVVEKILGAGETLPASWSAHGTTGYDFMDQVSALQHDPAGQSALDDLWIEISGRVASFETEETAARIEVLQGGFAGQLAACAAAFAEAAQVNIATRDLTAESFRRALVAFISHLRRYRSYATGDRGSLALDPALLDAFAKAKDSVLPDSPSLDFISALLSGDASAPQAIRQVAIRRLNQLTAPVAAKAVEDTAFYRYSRLISRNDVGFDASQFAMSPESFMQSGQRRAAESCEAMLTTATHDHKRGEDVRARLAVISELPDIWREAVLRWMELTSSTRPKSIASDDAYTLFQTLAGCWPLTLDPSDVESLEQFAERIALWRRKSLREAKQRSSWAAPDKGYEESNAEWLHALLRPGESPEFLDSMAKFVARIAPAGAINAIVQAALRCLWPGIPDLYQGSELWDLSLVDPDNRRPVDYGKRQSLLDEQARDWRSGAVKQAVIERLLQWRRANPHLFTRGALESLPTRGKKSRHVLAFRRHAPDCAADVAVMLHVAGPVLAFGNLPSKAWWEDTAVQIGGVWQEAAELFDRTPVYAAPGN